MQESIIPILPPPIICTTHATAILLRDCCAIYDLPRPRLPLYAIHHTILVVTISCKSKLWTADPRTAVYLTERSEYS